jgi:hypothetical protein
MSNGSFPFVGRFFFFFLYRGRHGRDRIVVAFTTTYVMMLWVRISIRVRCTTLCDKVCHWLATGLWFSPGFPVPSTNKADRHDITEILLKVALNTIKQTNFPLSPQIFYRTWLWVIRLVSHTKQKLFTLREHMKLTPVFW